MQEGFLNDTHESPHNDISYDFNIGRQSNFNNSHRVSNIKMKLLNVQSLSQAKMIEIEDDLDRETIYFLTETHKRDNSIRFKDSTNSIHKIREINDKKGGGLMMVWQAKLELISKEITSKFKDILVTEINIGRYKFISILVYMSVNDFKLNQEMNSEILSIIDKFDDFDIIILGDFNAHIGLIGYQKLNKNGEALLNIMDKCNLIMMNLDDNKTTGAVTWQRAEQKSSIDYVLVNYKMYNKLKSMIIDEDREIIGISDHNLICVNIEIMKPKKKKVEDYEEYSYFKMSEDRVKKLIDSMKEKLPEIALQNMEKFDKCLKECCIQELKISVKKKKLNSGETEPPWFNQIIRKEISNKRNLNKQIRKTENNEAKESLFEKLKDKKKMISSLVHKEITIYEQRTSKNIIEDKNRNKKLYENIRQLKGETKKKEEIIVYDHETGRKLEGQKLKDCLKEKWENIMSTTENKSYEEWNPLKKERYNQFLNQERVRMLTRRQESSHDYASSRIENSIYFDPQLREHLDYAFNINGNIINKMKKVKIEIEDLKKQIGKMKRNKSPGPDNIKIEIYKAILEDNEIISALCISMNKVIETGQIPPEWKQSKTVLLKKKKCPTVDDLRPIALTNCSYKILMGILKEKIEHHLFSNDVVEECQSGSTKGRRVQDNIKILQYCIERSFKNKKELYILAIDFKKAFDSVDRKMMINILKNYKIEPNVIDILYEVYRGDETKLFINNEECATIKVNTGIRQGCNCSGLLFIMVTYYIIGKIQRSGLGYRDIDFTIPCLFYADDGLIMAHNREDLAKLLKIIETSSAECGLQLNKEKCKIISFNNNDKQEIEGIRMVEELKYLGITVENKKRWYGKHIQDNINKGIKLSNYMYSIIGGSCNRLLIGKTFWKILALPSVLYGQETILYNTREIDQMQRVENKAYRTILNLPMYTAVEFLRGEIGSSTIIARDMKYKLLYYKYALSETNNSLLREIIINDLESQTEWYKKTKSYMDRIGITQGQLLSLSKENIKRKVDDWDTLQWREGMINKSTLSIYREYKLNIKEESWFFNSYKVTIMMKARSNTLKLNWREFGTEAAKQCKMCGQSIETLEHFILDCNRLQGVRSSYVELQRPIIEDKKNLLATILLLEGRCDGNTEYFIDLLWNLWNKREQILKEQ